MTLAIFDLDNTLLTTDSDYQWGAFLVAQGVVEKSYYTDQNDRFYSDYMNGSLDIHAFARFTLTPVCAMSETQRTALHKQFMQDVVQPNIPQASWALIEHHKKLGHTLMVITATNEFVTRPIVEHLGIEHILAMNIKRNQAGELLPEIDGIPTFQGGKVERLNAWLTAHDESLEGAYFYSDSRNDLPLLQQVDHPVAVNPDDTLLAHAKQHDWQVTYTNADMGALYPAYS